VAEVINVVLFKTKSVTFALEFMLQRQQVTQNVDNNAAVEFEIPPDLYLKAQIEGKPGSGRNACNTGTYPNGSGESAAPFVRGIGPE